MKSIGAFDAKTHFSELLRGVEQGESYEICRRGKPVARLAALESPPTPQNVDASLDFFRNFRDRRLFTEEEVGAWKEEGRR
jgi:prevent-host-death family protein